MEGNQNLDKSQERKERTKYLKWIPVCTIAIAIVISIIGGVLLFEKGYTTGEKTRNAHKATWFQYICMHDWYGGTGKCNKCGLICEHPDFDENAECTICGFHHNHEFENGICRECGKNCQHPSWYKGYCTECGSRCAHKRWVDDVCELCGIFCKHLEYGEGGCCVICGLQCEHKYWENGECTGCGMICDHSDHSQISQICNICGMHTYHEYINGVCSCGIVPPFKYDVLGMNLLGISAHQGNVTTVAYTTRRYEDDNSEITKNMDIYTPYGYSSQEKYNVILMVHGGGGHYYDWTTNPITVGSIMTSPKNLYDNMIEQGICKPFILVSITSTYYSDMYGETDSGGTQLAREIREDILPYIVNNYSTYASGASIKSISSAREHFGIGGLSNGSLYAYNCGILENFDLFGNFGCFSGCSSPAQYMEALNTEENIDLPIYCYMNAAGSYDTQRGNCYNGYNQIVDNTDRLEEGINAYYCEISSGHDWTTWTTAMYDFLMVFGGGKV